MKHRKQLTSLHKHQQIINKSTFKHLQFWAKETVQILDKEIVRLNIKDTDVLRKSLNQIVRQRANDVITIDIGFVEYGRFVDMGVGKGSSLVNKYKVTKEKSMNLLSKKKKKRKAKKFYSKVVYGRLYGLYGAIGYNLVEETIQTFKKLEKQTSI